MSVIVTATYEGEIFEVEIFRDGGIEFPGHDFEHDRTISALGEKPSIFVRFEDYWTKNAQDVMFKNFELPENSVVLLSADYAEHVLPIYGHCCPKDTRPRAAIEATRDFVAGKIDLVVLKRAGKLAWAAKDEAVSVAEVWAAEAAARVATASRAVTWAAARAAAYNVSSDSNSAEWHQSYNAEAAWQIRRFVDVMEAVGQGLPWPPLEATK